MIRETQNILKHQNALQTSLEGLGKPPSLDEFVCKELPREMRRHKGRKRLRKKKALRVLRERWALLMFMLPLKRRINYSEIGRKLVMVQPLPDAAKPYYLSTA